MRRNSIGPIGAGRRRSSLTERRSSVDTSRRPSKRGAACVSSGSKLSVVVSKGRSTLTSPSPCPSASSNDSQSRSRSASRSGSRVENVRRGSARRSTKKVKRGAVAQVSEEPLELVPPPSGSPNPAGFFRQNIVRRHVYSKAKEALDSKPPVGGRSRLSSVIGAVVTGTKQVLFKEKILGAFIRSSCEKQMKDMIKEITRHALKSRDWVTFKEALTDLLEESTALEVKYNGMVGLSTIRSDIEAMLLSCEQQHCLSLGALNLVHEASDMDVENKADAENAWQVLDNGEDKIQQAHNNVDDLWSMAVTVVAPDSPTIKRSASQELGARGRRNSRNFTTLSELHADLDAQIGAFPSETLQQLKDLIVAVTDSNMPEGLQQQCYKIIRGFGATETDVPKILERVRESAWKEVADAAMVALKGTTKETAEDIRNAKGKLAEQYPHLLASQSQDPNKTPEPYISEVSSLQSEPCQESCKSEQSPRMLVTDDEIYQPPLVPDAVDQTEVCAVDQTEVCLPAAMEREVKENDTEELIGTQIADKPTEISENSQEARKESLESQGSPHIDIAAISASLHRQQSTKVAGNTKRRSVQTPSEVKRKSDVSENDDVRRRIEERLRCTLKGGDSKGSGEDNEQPVIHRKNSVKKNEFHIPLGWQKSTASLAGDCSHGAKDVKEVIEDSQVPDPTQNMTELLNELHLVSSVKSPPEVSEQEEIELETIGIKPDPLYEFAIAASTQKESPRLSLVIALDHLQRHIVDNWGSVKEAAASISRTSISNQGDLMKVSMISKALQESGYPCDNGEVCSLFHMLGVEIAQEADVMLSRADFMRLSEFEKHVQNDDSHSKTWQSYRSWHHQHLHRLLVTSLSDPERLVAEIHIAKVRMMREMRRGSDALYAAPSTWPSLSSVLERCFTALCGLHAEEYAEVVVSRRGVAVLLDVILNPRIPTDVRALAVSVMSAGVERLGGRMFKARTWAERAAAQTVVADITSSKAWLVDARARSDAFMGSTDQLWRETKMSDMHLQLVPATDISTAPRVRIPTPPLAENDYQPGDFEIFLAKSLWRPILEHIDPDVTKPAPLSPAVFGQLLALLRQSQLPAVLVGPSGARVVVHVIAALRRLQCSQGRLKFDTYKVLAAIDDLCACVSSNTVHRIAAALGGRRLLRDRIAVLSDDTEPELVEEARNLVAEWTLERRRINLRWPLTLVKPLEVAKFDAIVKTAERTAAAAISSQEEPSAESVRPSLLTAPAPPKTAQLQPSLLLQMRGWNVGNDENLVSWLDGHAASLHSPRGYYCSRKNAARRRLPPIESKTV